jgi:hypothetical protein
MIIFAQALQGWQVTYIVPSSQDTPILAAWRNAFCSAWSERMQ